MNCVFVSNFRYGLRLREIMDGGWADQGLSLLHHPKQQLCQGQWLVFLFSQIILLLCLDSRIIQDSDLYQSNLVLKVGSSPFSTLRRTGAFFKSLLCVIISTLSTPICNELQDKVCLVKRTSSSDSTSWEILSSTFPVGWGDREMNWKLQLWAFCQQVGLCKTEEVPWENQYKQAQLMLTTNFCLMNEYSKYEWHWENYGDLIENSPCDRLSEVIFVFIHVLLRMGKLGAGRWPWR